MTDKYQIIKAINFFDLNKVSLCDTKNGNNIPYDIYDTILEALEIASKSLEKQNKM